MSFPRYPEYKDSGVEWLGEVPTTWGVAPLKRGYIVVGGSTPKSDNDSYWDGEIVWITPADLSRVKGFKVSDSLRRITAAGLQSCGTTLVPPGSVLLSTRAPIGSLGIADTELCTNQGCKALVPAKEHLSNFAGYFLSVATDALNVRGKGTTFLELSAEELGSFKIPCPTFLEQKVIVNFLDSEIAKIDALVAEQEKLMALLKEKRQAVISHAVTKGLDTTVPMKDSGVEWLGEVPAHWEATRLARICMQINDINHVMPVAIEEGVPFLSAKDLLDDGTLNFTNDIKQISETDFLVLSKKICPERGDIIYSRIGACLGKARLVETDVRFLVSYSCCVIRVIEDIASNRFIRHLLDGDMMLTEARIRTQGIGVPDLGLGEIGRFPVPLPPMDEQHAIAEFLDREARAFDLLSLETQSAISLLKERRSALISTAVTGKIDVRGLAKASAA